MRARVGSVGAVEQTGEFGPPRAEEAGQADDLASVQIEVGGFDRALATDPDRSEDRLSVRFVRFCWLISSSERSNARSLPIIFAIRSVRSSSEVRYSPTY